MITMHFISAQKCLDNRDNRPRNTCVSQDKLGFFSFSYAMFFFPRTELRDKMIQETNKPAQNPGRQEIFFKERLFTGN